MKHGKPQQLRDIYLYSIKCDREINEIFWFLCFNIFPIFYLHFINSFVVLSNYVIFNLHFLVLVSPNLSF